MHPLTSMRHEPSFRLAVRSKLTAARSVHPFFTLHCCSGTWQDSWQTSDTLPWANASVHLMPCARYCVHCAELSRQRVAGGEGLWPWPSCTAARASHNHTAVPAVRSIRAGGAGGAGPYSVMSSCVRGICCGGSLATTALYGVRLSTYRYSGTACSRPRPTSTAVRRTAYGRTATAVQP
jgi:hypothetical protein